ncbi:MAG TPA: radical SAM protein, partial [Deinococcales bacterium]|nr:radical SAM protein [Deinococcales bacterium]
MTQPLPAIRHLYAHVPFCPRVCPYCDFHVLTRSAGMVEAYLAELGREAGELSARFPAELETVYLGGGTPSFLRDREMAALVGTIRDHFGWASGEATLEVNPGTVTPERAALWKSLGFNRASVGVQSFDDRLLKWLGRTHDAGQARRAVETLSETGLRVSL